MKHKLLLPRPLCWNGAQMLGMMMPVLCRKLAINARSAASYPAPSSSCSICGTLCRSSIVEFMHPCRCRANAAGLAACQTQGSDVCSILGGLSARIFCYASVSGFSFASCHIGCTD
ncbi:hypothetical protein ACQKWADRAFT_281333 [Trichoderma austrokoningii]